ncbi:MAG: hypothetical protein ACRDM1_01895 [Gaiellaceae bacterium]
MRVLALLAATAAVLSVAAAPAGAVPTTTMTLGSTFTLSGLTGSSRGTVRAVGLVVLSGRWQDGRWHRLTSTRTDKSGRYRLRLRPHRRGLLRLRIVLPDKYRVSYLLRVV